MPGDLGVPAGPGHGRCVVQAEAPQSHHAVSQGTAGGRKCGHGKGSYGRSAATDSATWTTGRVIRRDKSCDRPEGGGCPSAILTLVSLPLHFSGQLISLRDFTPADAEALASLAYDDAIFEFTKGRIDPSWLARVVPQFLAEPEPASARRTFSLAAIAEERFVGFAVIGPVTDEGQAEFGWYLRSDAWGHGYATDATNLLLSFGFNELGLARIFATADPENTASIRVLTKSGLNCEGPTDSVHTWRGIRPRLLFTIDSTSWNAGPDASPDV